MRNLMTTRGWSAVLFVGLLAGPALAQKSVRESVDSAGLEGNDASQRPSISRNARRVAFASDADNLAMGDANLATDVFLRNEATGMTYLVSRNSGGVQGNGASDDPHLAALGSFVAFRSDATNLVGGDVNMAGDVFLRDLTGGATALVSVNSGGALGDGASFEPFVTANGRFVAFTSLATNLDFGDMNGLEDCFVHDFSTGNTWCITLNGAGVINANGPSHDPTLSADGRFAAFASDASNLVAGDNNAATDVFLRNLVTGVTRRISATAGGVDANGASSKPWISEDGRFVVYQSKATNLVAGDVNMKTDVFVFDRVALTTTLVSTSSNGGQGDDDSSNPVISSTGDVVAFTSLATNLIPSDTNLTSDVFVHDMNLVTTHRVSLTHYLGEPTGSSDWASISGDGQTVAFESDAADIVPNDMNAVIDVFEHAYPLATSTNYGAGLAGTFGVPAILLSADPVIGTSPILVIGNSNPMPTNGLLFIGLSTANQPTGWGGNLLVNPVQVLPIALPAGALNLSFDVPFDETLEGSSLYLQALENDPGAIMGFSFTRGLHARFGW